MPDLQKTETYVLTNEYPTRISPHAKPMKLLPRLRLNFPLFAFLAHK